MSTIPAVETRTPEKRLATSRSGHPADSVRLDWWQAIVTCFMIFGLFIDGWAHNHDRVDNTFFTPWHAILYSAYGVAALSLIVLHFRNVGRGYRWNRALPVGYMPALVGVFLFAIAGTGDLFWHELFGFEESLEALLSPSHLILALAGLLINTGPIRALWQRQTASDWRSLMPAILAFTAITCVFTFFMSFAAVTGKNIVLTGVRPETHMLTDVYGVQALLVHSNILLGVILFMSRRWRLPFGAVTFIYTVNAALMTWIHVDATAEFLLVANAALIGFIGDLLLRRNSRKSKGGIRLFSFLLPFGYGLGALIVMHILGTTAWGRGELWWEIHMWLGAPVLAGAFGYGLSLLVHPPASPTDYRQ